MVNFDRALLADKERRDFRIRIHLSARSSIQIAEFFAVRTIPLTIHGLISGLFFSEIKVNRTISVYHLNIPFTNGLAGDISLPVLLEIVCYMFALGVVHIVFAENDFVMAAFQHQLGKVAEFGIAQFRSYPVSGCNAVPACGAPHGSKTVVLAACGKHDFFSADRCHGAIQHREYDRTFHAVLIAEKVGHNVFVHEANALFLGSTTDLYRDIQIYADHRRHGTGRPDI